MHDRQLFTKAQWRSFVLFLSIVIGVADIWALAHVARSTQADTAGTLGVMLGAPQADYSYPIEGLKPDSPLIAAGAHIGDRVHLEHRADSSRSLDVNEFINLTLISGGTSRQITVKPIPNAQIAAAPVTAVVLAASEWGLY